MEKEKPISRSNRPFFKFDPVTTIIATAGIFLVSQIFAAIVIWVYPALKDWTENEAALWLTESVAAQFLFILLVSIAVIFMVVQTVRRAGIKLSRLGLVAFRLRDVGWALVAYGLYFITYLAVVVVASMIVPGLNTGQEQQIGFDNVSDTFHLLMAFASLVVLPPLTEELLFRGFLYSSLRARFRIRHAMLITGILFAIPHLQFGVGAPLLWVAAIDTFILSCFLCYIKEKLGSIWPAVMLHAIKNCVAFIILFNGRF